MAVPNADNCFRKFNKLLNKACKLYRNEDRAPCLWFYRNEYEEYFRNIYDDCGGIMEVKPKDNNGDPDCPINGGNLSGLFFMASVRNGSESGEPLPMSPFGPCRLLVPVKDLLRSSNLYFSDFYCMTNSGYHYITLVITRQDSEADDFCREHLPEVDLFDNPFLSVGVDDVLYVTTADHLLVEVFYTEDLDISEYEVQDDIPLVGKGHSTPGGLPKIWSCTVCNL